MPSAPVTTRRLGPTDIPALRIMNTLFAHAFDDPKSYAADPPGDAWLERLLADRRFIAIAAYAGDAVVGALCAYELVKFDQQRSEVYIYDLAVAQAHRRCGVATALIAACGDAARACGAHAMFIQAARDDPPAVALYEGLGTKEEVLHFDLRLAPSFA